MDNLDTLSVILGFCDCGSDYKSWALVCSVWLGLIQKAFCVPRMTFGNKLVNIIEDTGVLDNIMMSSWLRNSLLENNYVSQTWKDANISIHDREVAVYPQPYYDIETMNKIYNQTGKKFSSRMMFYRPFSNDQSFIDFCVVLLNNQRIMKPYSERYYHPSISLKALQESSLYFEVSWRTIPITHHSVLTVDDWNLLIENGCIDPQGTAITHRTDLYTFTSWCRYPTTTLEMILSNIPNSYNYPTWILGFIISCPNCSHKDVVDAIKTSGLLNHDFSSFSSYNRFSISDDFSAALNLVTREFW